MFRPSPRATAICAGALLGVLSLTPQSASAATEFRGGGYMIDFAGCEVLGWAGGEQLVARIRPGGLPDNDPTWTYMTVLFNSGAINFKFQPDPGNWFAVTTTSMFRLAFEYESLMRITDVYPAVIENTTDFIFIEAEIDGFESQDGCSARMHLTFALN